MLVWANMHGSVVYGGVALVAACVAALVVHVAERTPESRRRLLILAGVTIAGGLLTLVTPLGTELWHYVASSGSRPGETQISEWSNTLHLHTIDLCFWGWVILVAGLAVWRWRRLRGWPMLLEAAVAIAFLPLAIDQVRNVGAFGIASLPLAISLARSARPRLRPTGAAAPAIAAGVGVGVVAAVVGALAGVLPGMTYWTMPAATVRAIESCPGNEYTTYNSGAYLIWFTPTVKVFQDNRQDPYPADVLKYMYLEPNDGHETIFDRYDIRCAALEKGDGSSITTLQGEGWSTAYDDGRWLVLTKPGVSLRPH
jgi:hypothetical protein